MIFNPTPRQSMWMCFATSVLLIVCAVITGTFFLIALAVICVAMSAHLFYQICQLEKIRANRVRFDQGVDFLWESLRNAKTREELDTVLRAGELRFSDKKYLYMSGEELIDIAKKEILNGA